MLRMHTHTHKQYVQCDCAHRPAPPAASLSRPLSAERQPQRIWPTEQPPLIVDVDGGWPFFKLLVIGLFGGVPVRRVFVYAGDVR